MKMNNEPVSNYYHNGRWMFSIKATHKIFAILVAISIITLRNLSFNTGTPKSRSLLNEFTLAQNSNSKLDVETDTYTVSVPADMWRNPHMDSSWNPPELPNCCEGSQLGAPMHTAKHMKPCGQSMALRYYQPGEEITANDLKHVIRQHKGDLILLGDSLNKQYFEQLACYLGAWDSWKGFALGPPEQDSFEDKISKSFLQFHSSWMETEHLFGSFEIPADDDNMGNVQRVIYHMIPNYNRYTQEFDKKVVFDFITFYDQIFPKEFGRERPILLLNEGLWYNDFNRIWGMKLVDGINHMEQSHEAADLQNMYKTCLDLGARCVFRETTPQHFNNPRGNGLFPGQKRQSGCMTKPPDSFSTLDRWRNEVLHDVVNEQRMEHDKGGFIKIMPLFDSLAYLVFAHPGWDCTHYLSNPEFWEPWHVSLTQVLREAVIMTEHISLTQVQQEVITTNQEIIPNDSKLATEYLPKQGIETDAYTANVPADMWRNPHMDSAWNPPELPNCCKGAQLGTHTHSQKFYKVCGESMALRYYQPGKEITAKDLKHAIHQHKGDLIILGDSLNRQYFEQLACYLGAWDSWKGFTRKPIEHNRDSFEDDITKLFLRSKPSWMEAEHLGILNERYDHSFFGYFDIPADEDDDTGMSQKVIFHRMPSFDFWRKFSFDKKVVSDFITFYDQIYPKEFGRERPILLLNVGLWFKDRLDYRNNLAIDLQNIYKTCLDLGARCVFRETTPQHFNHPSGNGLASPSGCMTKPPDSFSTLDQWRNEILHKVVTEQRMEHDKGGFIKIMPLFDSLAYLVFAHDGVDCIHLSNPEFWEPWHVSLTQVLREAIVTTDQDNVLNDLKEAF